jgi:hypothetical protein
MLKKVKQDVNGDLTRHVGRWTGGQTGQVGRQARWADRADRAGGLTRQASRQGRWDDLLPVNDVEKSECSRKCNSGNDVNLLGPELDVVEPLHLVVRILLFCLSLTPEENKLDRLFFATLSGLV